MTGSKCMPSYHDNILTGKYRCFGDSNLVAGSPGRAL